MVLRSFFVLGWVAVCGCSSASPLHLGGGEAYVYDVASACPASHPQRHEAGDHVVCADAAFTVSGVSRADCEAAGIDCDALYGCAPVALSSCESTRTTADCGGDGPPTFACEPGFTGSGCRWYLHGCLAEGAIPSSCPSDDLCCVPQTQGVPSGTQSYAPFASEVGGSYYNPNAVYVAGLFTSHFGTRPIGLDDSFVVPVLEVDPPDATGVVVTCPTPTSTIFCAWEPKQSWSNGSDDFGVYANNLGTTGYTVEIRTVDGVKKARVCSYLTTDLAVTTCTSDAAATHGNCEVDGLVELGTSRIRVTAGSGAYAVVFEIPR